jgi:2,3-bisphosphoglycerate-dependent phosphoglycerate mutase
LEFGNERAYNTAQIISNKTGLEVFTEEDLRERNFGILQGLTKQEMHKHHPKEYDLLRTAGPDFVIPEGESATQFFRRCVKCVEKLALKHRQEKIIVVTHMGVLRSALRYALGIPIQSPRRFKVPPVTGS